MLPRAANRRRCRRFREEDALADQMKRVEISLFFSSLARGFLFLFPFTHAREPARERARNTREAKRRRRGKISVELLKEKRQQERPFWSPLTLCLRRRQRFVKVFILFLLRLSFFFFLPLNFACALSLSLACPRPFRSFFKPQDTERVRRRAPRARLSFLSQGAQGSPSRERERGGEQKRRSKENLAIECFFFLSSLPHPRPSSSPFVDL